MDNMDLEVLRQVQQWHTDGRRVVLGTITRTWGSSPRPVGSVVAVRGDGQIAGSVSGGCIEDDLVAKIKDGALALDDADELVKGIRLTKDGSVVHPNFAAPDSDKKEG
jgi:xanthine dehydrogenase accessory factor